MRGLAAAAAGGYFLLQLIVRYSSSESEREAETETGHGVALLMAYFLLPAQFGFLHR